MTNKQKLLAIKAMLGRDAEGQDDVLAVYLKQAEHEIIAWHFGDAGFDDGDIEREVPAKYDIVQINAVVVGFNIRGAEGQSQHDENTIKRVFAYEDMVHYIHAHVPQRVVIY